MELIKFKPFENTAGHVTGYIHSLVTEMPVHRKKYPAVVVCPGGGYEMCSQREADPVAFKFFSAGYNVFILEYSVGDSSGDFTPLKELSETLVKIRENAEVYHVDPDKIAVCGFSAGGHLTASLGTLWNNKEFLRYYDNKGGQNRPNALILSYPVILAGEFEHKGSIDRVSNISDGSIPREFFSLDTKVSKETPKTFIWTTVEDTCVPAENTMAFIAALKKAGVSFEAHFLPNGDHGMSICTDEVGCSDEYNAKWMQLSISWLNMAFDFQE